MNTAPNETLRNFLSQQSNQSILAEFNHTTNQHFIYNPISCRTTARKPTRSRTIVTPKQQIFFYYLNLLPVSLRTKFHSLTKPAKNAMQQIFRSQSVRSSSQAINILSLLLMEKI